jgi:hypothetical protein
MIFCGRVEGLGCRLLDDIECTIATLVGPEAHLEQAVDLRGEFYILTGDGQSLAAVGCIVDISARVGTIVFF